MIPMLYSCSQALRSISGNPQEEKEWDSSTQSRPQPCCYRNSEVTHNIKEDLKFSQPKLHSQFEASLDNLVGLSKSKIQCSSRCITTDVAQ